MSTVREVHVFDLDGTLTRKDTFVPFLVGLMLRHPQKLVHTPALLLAAYRYLRKKIDNEALKRIFLSRLTANLQNQAIVQWSQRHAQRIVRHGLRSEGLARMRQLIESGQTVALATASPDLYVLPLAGLLDIEHVICTVTEERHSGCACRDLAGRNCYGEEKGRRVKAWLQGVEADGQVHVYTDHHADIPLLKIADKPLAVCPTAALRQYALREHIRIENWR